MPRRALVLAVVVAACGDDPAPATSPAPDAGAPAADELFTSSEDCAPGTRAAVGSAACVPVGTTTCAAGFEKAPSGWGCAPVLPPSACTGATRPALGSRACVPVGDCAAPFPPPNAIVVDPTLADGAIDATHVRTLADAVGAASDGATIALADGTHDLATLTLLKRLTIVGRCAERTKLVPAPGASTGLRLLAETTIRGLTFSGVDTPIEPNGAAASVIGEDLVVEGARFRAVLAVRRSKTVLRRVVVRGTVARTPGDQTIAVIAGGVATIAIEDGAVLDSFDAAVAAVEVPGTRVTLTRSVVDGSTAAALRAFEGAELDVVDSAILHGGGMAVLALHRKRGYPKVTLTRSVVADTATVVSGGDELSTAINAAFGSIVELHDTTIDGTKGVGVYSAEAAKVSLDRSVVTRTTGNAVVSGWSVSATRTGELSIVSSALVGAPAAGVGAFEGGKVSLDRSLVRAIGGAVSQGLPLGFALNAGSRASIVATASSLVDAQEIGAIAGGDGTTIDLDHVLVTRTPQARPAQFGHAVLAAYGSAIGVRGSIVERHPGVGLFYASGAGTVSRSLVRGNGIGAHVQEGSSLVEADAPPDAPGPSELVVTKDVRFVDNATRTGAGELPIPKLVDQPAR